MNKLILKKKPEPGKKAREKVRLQRRANEREIN